MSIFWQQKRGSFGIYFFFPEPTLAFLVPRTFFWRFFNSFRCLRAFLSTFSASPWRINLSVG